jgi:hypothetical protein
MDRIMRLIGKQVLLLAVVLVGPLAVAVHAEQQMPADANDKNATAAIAKHLDIGAKGGQLPADFAVTIETTGQPTKESGVTNAVFQAWRFTGNTVSRLDPSENVMSTFAFQEIQAVCRMLRDGDIVGLSNSPRGKERQAITLLGTPCSFGYESIKVTVEGKMLAVHGQSCWVANFADQKDQQRFDRMYARLRAMAMVAEVVRWGREVNGLQMGISAGWDVTGVVKPLFDGTNIVFGVNLRNCGDSTVRLLPSIYTCLLGNGEPLLVSEVIFKPKNGGPSITARYKGWNHLSLEDEQRAEGEQPQQTLDKSFGKTGFQISAENAKRLMIVLEPGDMRGDGVRFAVAPKGKYFWEFDGVEALPPGAYEMSATLKIDQQQSEWKGELVTPSFEIEVPAP